MARPVGTEKVQYQFYGSLEQYHYQAALLIIQTLATRLNIKRDGGLKYKG